MAKTYFLNAQDQSVLSIQLNGGQSFTLAGLNSQPPENPCCAAGLAVDAAEDTLGTGSVNTLSVQAVSNQSPILWTIEMKGISPAEDIQFLVFENALLVRQGYIVEGFTITKQ